MEKPILDCSLNNPPSNVDRLDWQLKLVSDFRFIRASFVWIVSRGSVHSNHGGRNSVKEESDIRGTVHSTQGSIWTLAFKNKKHGPSCSVSFHYADTKGYSNSEKKAIFVLRKGDSQAHCRCCLISFRFSFQLKRKFKQSGFTRSQTGLNRRNDA